MTWWANIIIKQKILEETCRHSPMFLMLVAILNLA